MAWRFRKSVKLIPGVRLNFSSRGMSTTIGGRGAGINFSGRGVYGYASIPGTGISFRERLDKPSAKPPYYLDDRETPELPTLFTEYAENIVSVDVQEITSQDMLGVKNLILATHEQRKSIAESITKVERDCTISKVKLIGSYIFLVGLFYKKLASDIKIDIASQKDVLAALKEQEENSFVRLEVQFDSMIQRKYDAMRDAFVSLTKTHRVWDLTSSHYNDRVKTRSAASTIVSRKPTEIGRRVLSDIRSDDEPFYFKNINGADLYFYPNFLIAYNSKEKFAIVGYDELNFQFVPTRFLETESVPQDSRIIEYTWAKVNKNGSRDKRFKDNYQIPIVQYGNIELKSATGLHEVYEFSNYDASRQFSEAFLDFQNTIVKLKPIRPTEGE